MNSMSVAKLKFIKKEFTNLDLDMSDSRVINVWYEVIAACSILSKKQITQLIYDHLELRGLK